MILVSGATGFLGTELVAQLLDKGFKVRALKRQASVIPPALLNRTGLQWAEADILNYFDLEKAMDGVEEVYHCAAIVSFDQNDKDKMLKVSREGTAHIVNLCMEKRIKKLLHVSSIAALGEAKPGLPVTEKTYWEYNGKQNGYSIAKYESEMEVWRGISEGLNAVIVNPSIIIGRGARDGGIKELFKLDERMLRYYPPGIAALVDVEDVARAMILLMESEISQERFILNAENVRYKELFAEFARLRDIPGPAIELKAWMGTLMLTFLKLANYVTGRKPSLTKAALDASFSTSVYSANRFLNKFPHFKFKSFKESLREL